jgi:serine/threonine protein kinase
VAEGMAPGEVLSGRFELQAQVGRGGMGTVWRALDRETGDTVAVKLLHGYFADNQAYRDRFAREVDLAQRVATPRIARVLGYGARDGVPFIVQEYVDGTTLAELIRTHGPYTWAETRTLMLAAARALADVHAADVVHRDVKPSNIMVTSDGRVKLTDFGIARALDLARLTGASTMLGTPAYLAPEGQVDERSDLYALGVVGYEVLVGQPPFAGDSTQGILLAHINTAPDLSRIPAEARPTIGWLLAKDPAQRPQSANALIAGLDGSTPVPPLKVPPAAGRAGKSRMPLIAGVGVVAVALVAVLVIGGGVLGKGASASPSAEASAAAAVPTAPSAPPSGDASSAAPATSAPTAPPTAPPTPAPTEPPTAGPTDVPTTQPSAPNASLPASGGLLAIPAWPDDLATVTGQPYPPNWYSLKGSLISKGSGDSYLPVFSPTVADYTVTARMQRIKSGQFGIVVRGTDKDGYLVTFAPSDDSTQMDIWVHTPSGDTRIAQNYQIDSSRWHDYAVAISGITLTVSIDGRQIDQPQRDAQLTDAGSIAIRSNNCQLEVSSFTVTSP